MTNIKSLHYYLINSNFLVASAMKDARFVLD